MIWIWISVVMLVFGGFLEFLKMQRLIKSTITIIFIFIIIIFYLSLGKENNYDTVNLVGKK